MSMERSKWELRFERLVQRWRKETTACFHVRSFSQTWKKRPFLKYLWHAMMVLSRDFRGPLTFFMLLSSSSEWVTKKEREKTCNSMESVMSVWRKREYYKPDGYDLALILSDVVKSGSRQRGTPETARLKKIRNKPSLFLFFWLDFLEGFSSWPSNSFLVWRLMEEFLLKK